ncbi:hypothetical protein I7I53_07428 [Histoplasma capsulatum var. duboisii H88]|uniref:Uncharacterized protein n=1 Tax=Ajellomyces capsulatus (strain H88) TaxID=544711 RepID=A0A8A1LH30_AJEC8|nr:hypothetical protein I7I53_07428 [Histoplasma capsulatum var. duboisii H88]
MRELNSKTKTSLHTRCECRIQHIKINTYIRLIVPDAVFNLLHDATCADAVNVAGCDDVKPAPDIIFYVIFGTHYGPRIPT